MRSIDHTCNERVDTDIFRQQPHRLVKVVRDKIDDLAPAILQAPLDQRPLNGSDEHAVRLDAVV